MGLEQLYTPKQIEVLKRVRQNDWNLLINHGAKSSGKTILDNDLFLLELKRVRKIADKLKIPNPQYILAGFTLSAINSNVLRELTNKYGFVFTFDKYNNFELFGVKVVQTSTGSISGVGRIRGMTAFGAYINEASLANEEVFDEIKARCRGEGARIICDTNPDHPEHWLKRDYIDKSDGKLVISYHFSLDDNTFLNERYKLSQKQTTPKGMLYDRAILGLWVSGKGTIYNMFDKEKHYIDSSQINNIRFDRYIAGVDFGFAEGHEGVIVVFGVKGDKYYLIEEHAHTGWYIEQWCDLALNMIDKYGDIPFFCDSARPEHVAKMRDMGIQAILSNKRVLSGIETVSKLYYQGKLFITNKAQIFNKEIYNYVWNEKTGEPIKKHDNVQDAIRYALHTDSIVNQQEPMSADEGADLIHKMKIY
ncbi:PBSX family phage terminase large subunit [Enterococcus faecalis]